MTEAPIFKTTRSGARVAIIRDHDLWLAIRDDGLPIFRAQTLEEVAQHISKYGDVLDPGPRSDGT